mmetsp:Transcript_40572/g.121054  ORF Transcript_40572/g.121054 Transcript_40572/m.121054 type:complete len:218 (-) Transcript_40572:38-691(-)
MRPSPNASRTMRICSMSTKSMSGTWPAHTTQKKPPMSTTVENVRVRNAFMRFAGSSRIFAARAAASSSVAPPPLPEPPNRSRRIEWLPPSPPPQRPAAPPPLSSSSPSLGDSHSRKKRDLSSSVTTSAALSAERAVRARPAPPFPEAVARCLRVAMTESVHARVWETDKRADGTDGRLHAHAHARAARSRTRGLARPRKLTVHCVCSSRVEFPERKG